MAAGVSTRPQLSDYPPPFERYVSLVPEAEVLEVLERQKNDVRDALHSVPRDRESFRYASGKWSIRQLAGHIIDAERVFGYRALCISRSDPNALPGFDENHYVGNASFDARPLGELSAEFDVVRSSNNLLFRHLAPEAWDRRGIANGKEITVRALAFVMAGHVRHHLGILATRYA